MLDHNPFLAVKLQLIMFDRLSVIMKSRRLWDERYLVKKIPWSSYVAETSVPTAQISINFNIVL